MEGMFIVETSARHIHLSEKDLATLFGEGHQLTNKKDLSQPGQFACVERVKVIGPKGELNMSPIDFAKQEILFARSQKYYPYIAKQEWIKSERES